MHESLETRKLLAAIANDDSSMVPEDSPTQDIFVLANDTDGGLDDNLSVIAVTAPSNGGSVVNGPTGQHVSYTPAPNFFGIETFRYTIRDSDDNSTSTATVSVSVAARNDPPNAIDDMFSFAANSTNNPLNLLVNDFDIDGILVRVSGLIAANLVGTINFETHTSGVQSITYTPAPNFAGQETFMYTVVDNDGGEDTATVTINVVDTGSIRGTAFVDWKHMGYDPEFDEPKAGVTVVLSGINSAGQQVDEMTTTDASGQYRFDNLLPSAAYTITAGVPRGQTPTTPMSFTTDLESGEHLVGGINANDPLVRLELLFGSAVAGNVVKVDKQGNDLMLLGNLSNNHVEMHQTKNAGEFYIHGAQQTLLYVNGSLVPSTTVNFVNGDIGVMLGHGDDWFEFSGADSGGLSHAMHDLTIENDWGSNTNVIDEVIVMRDLTVYKTPGVWGYNHTKILNSIVEGNTLVHTGSVEMGEGQANEGVVGLLQAGNDEDTDSHQHSGGDSKTLIENSQLKGREVQRTVTYTVKVREQMESGEIVYRTETRTRQELIPALSVLNADGFDIVDIRDTKVGVNTMGDTEIINGNGGSRTTFTSENGLGNFLYGNLVVTNGVNPVGVQVYDTVILNKTDIDKSTTINNMDGDSMVVVMDNSVLGSSTTLATMEGGQFTSAGKLMVHNSAGIDEFMMKDSRAPFGVVIEHGGQGHLERYQAGPNWNVPKTYEIDLDAIDRTQMYGSRTDIINSEIGTNLKSDGGLIVRGDDKDDVVNVIDSWIGGLRGIDVMTYDGNDDVWLYLKGQHVSMVYIDTAEGMDEVRLEDVHVTNATMIDLGAGGLDKLELLKATRLLGSTDLEGGAGEMDHYSKDVDVILEHLFLDGFEDLDFGP